MLMRASVVGSNDWQALMLKREVG